MLVFKPIKAAAKAEIEAAIRRAMRSAIQALSCRLSDLASGSSTGADIRMLTDCQNAMNTLLQAFSQLSYSLSLADRLSVYDEVF